MHIGAVPNRGSHPTILLRQSYREGDRVRKRTIANLTPLPPHVIEILRWALKVGEVINWYKVGKHFCLHIEDNLFRWERDETSIEQEAALDGIYVIRTSEPKKRLSAPDMVRSYKNLAQVERGFRCLKGIDIRVRRVFPVSVWEGV